MLPPDAAALAELGKELSYCFCPQCGRVLGEVIAAYPVLRATCVHCKYGYQFRRLSNGNQRIEYLRRNGEVHQIIRSRHPTATVENRPSKYTCQGMVLKALPPIILGLLVAVFEAPGTYAGSSPEQLLFGLTMLGVAGGMMWHEYRGAHASLSPRQRATLRAVQALTAKKLELSLLAAEQQRATVQATTLLRNIVQQRSIGANSADMSFSLLPDLLQQEAIAREMLVRSEKLRAGYKSMENYADIRLQSARNGGPLDGDPLAAIEAKVRELEGIVEETREETRQIEAGRELAKFLE